MVTQKLIHKWQSCNGELTLKAGYTK